MTWEALADIQRAAARHLFASNDSAYDRAVCGRAYFAAYALVTSRLPAGTIFGRGWRNPPHAMLPAYVVNIARLREPARREVRRALRRLRQRREDADYRPGVTVDRTSARESMRDASQIFAILTGRWRMNKSELIKSVSSRLGKVGHGIKFDIVSDGVRRDDAWWYVPVLATRNGKEVPREFTVNIFANIEDELEREQKVSVLFIPAVAETVPAKSRGK